MGAELITAAGARKPRTQTVPDVDSLTGRRGSAVVDVAAVPERDDNDEEHVVLNGVDDAIVTDPNAESWSAFQGSGGRWTRVLRQKCDRALDPATDRRVELAQRSYGRWSQLDPVFAHSQPRSAFTWSQGMFGPSSSIAASNATMSSASSAAAMSCS